MEFWVDVENGSWLVDILNVNSCYFSNSIFRKHCGFIAFASRKRLDLASDRQTQRRPQNEQEMNMKYIQLTMNCYEHRVFNN